MNIQMKIDVSTLKELKTIISETVEEVIIKLLPKIQPSKMAQNPDDKLLTRKEVMEMLQITHSTLYHYQIDGIIPYKKIGNRVYFKKEDILNNPKLDGFSY